MLQCFSFAYKTLEEEEVYTQLNLPSTGSKKSTSSSKTVTNKNNFNNSYSNGDGKEDIDNSSNLNSKFQLEINQATFDDRVPPVPVRIDSSSPSSTKQHTKRSIDKFPSGSVELAERYTRLPITSQRNNKPPALPPKKAVFECPHLDIVPPPPTRVSDSAHFCRVPPPTSRKRTMPKTGRAPPATTASTTAGPDGATGNGVSGSSCTNNSRPNVNADDWNRTDGFVNKPSRGWIHPNKRIADGGICYGVRYVGCLDVNASMKSLDFETRSLVAKECINRVCEAAGLKTVDKKRKIEKKITRMLADKPNMEYAGSNVNLTISSAALNLSIMESGEVIANHEMPNVSFASGGDPETLDFVAYVAKSGSGGRACYVLECGGGLAQDVITTIGQAFELRFKEYLKKTPRSSATASRNEDVLPSTDDPEYYNDLPGKIPPEAIPPVPPLPNYQNDQCALEAAASKLVTGVNSSRGSVDNLIDLSSEPSSPNPLIKKAEHDYVNGCVAEANGRSNSKDPFDMQPFENTLLQPDHPASQELNLAISRQQSKVGPSTMLAQLLTEEWFHGPISRKEAEALLIHDGDFLVRESQGSSGQFVLSGMHHGVRKHLLLVDPEGVVRTKDRMFDSVSHLVKYHMNNGLPIISADSALVLRNAIVKVCRPPVR